MKSPAVISGHLGRITNVLTERSWYSREISAQGVKSRFVDYGY